ncbi:MAG: hypothetical protein ACPL7R_01400 [Anaerolineae bacterium]
MPHVWYNSRVEKNSRGIGVIEALTAGFELVARRPWVILLPIAVNLLIWLGPRLSVAHLTEQVAAALRSGVGSQTGQFAEAALSAASRIAEWGQQSNLFALLAVGLPVLAVRTQAQHLWALDNWTWAVGLAAGILVLGGYLLAVYLGVLGRRVRGVHESVARALAHAARVLWRLAALSVVVLGITTVLAIPAMMTVGVLSFFYPQGAMFLATLTGWLAIGFLIWVWFYLFFALDAMVLDDVGVRQAVSRSVTLVRLNGGATAGLILLTLTLTWGLGVVWDAMAASTAGTVVAILANAYVSTALAAASLIFYSSRWRVLEQRIVALAAASGESAPTTDRANPSGE